MTDRKGLGREICVALDKESARLKNDWARHAPINYFVLDDVLPVTTAQAIRDAFPKRESMTLRKSMRETKYVTAQMNRYNALLEEAIFAFQVPEVVERIEAITGLRALEPDEMLYAGGISLMARGNFLNPHVDNSHDKQRSRYRVLNLLYYVSPGWTEANGCNLELWPQGPRGEPTRILSKFNRLVVMVTHQGSWHSVSANVTEQDRCCVSNYYFSRHPVGDAEYFHVTRFRGRPEQPLRDLLLRCDGALRQVTRAFFPRGVKETRHFYNRNV